MNFFKKINNPSSRNIPTLAAFVVIFSTSETDKKISMGRTTSRGSAFESPDVGVHFKHLNQMYLTDRKIFTGP